MEYDRGDVFPFDFLNQIEFNLVQNREENCYHDHNIPLNLKGNENIVFSVQGTLQLSPFRSWTDIFRLVIGILVMIPMSKYLCQNFHVKIPVSKSPRQNNRVEICCDTRVLTH